MVNRYTGDTYITRVRTEDDFFKYVVRSPRNYTVVILFNSDRACVACREVDRNFEELAVAYAEQKGKFEGSNHTSFFFRVPIESMYSVSSKMGIKTAPALLYVPPVKGIGFPHKVHQVLNYVSSSYEMSAYEMSTFLEGKGLIVCFYN